MIGVGVGMMYGYSLLITFMHNQNEIEIQKYCPQGLEDKSNPCGLIIDSPLPMFITLGIVVYVLVFFSQFVEPPKVPSTQSQDSNRENNNE